MNTLEEQISAQRTRIAELQDQRAGVQGGAANDTQHQTLRDLDAALSHERTQLGQLEAQLSAEDGTANEPKTHTFG